MTSGGQKKAFRKNLQKELDHPLRLNKAKIKFFKDNYIISLDPHPQPQTQRASQSGMAKGGSAKTPSHQKYWETPLSGEAGPPPLRRAKRAGKFLAFFRDLGKNLGFFGNFGDFS